MRGFLLFFALMLPLAGQSTRTWTDTDGRSLSATVTRVDDTHVTLQVRGKDYRWPLEKLVAEDRAFLTDWRKADDAERAKRLATLVGSFKSQALSTRAYTKPEDYLAGEVLDSYLKRIEPTYRKDMLESLNYEIDQQTAALHVPASYDESVPFGVYVEVSSNSRSYLPKADYQAVFAKHRLIYICPHGAGNSKHLGYRMGLALDALATLKAGYQIDDSRCYIGGVSGGGYSSTLINFFRPEHFRGAVNIARGALLETYTIEKDTFVNDSRSYEKGQVYPSALPGLDDKHVPISLRYRDKRWAFVSGEKDFNYEFTKISEHHWQKRGYKAKYFHVPGLGHQPPPGETLDAVLSWMEE